MTRVDFMDTAQPGTRLTGADMETTPVVGDDVTLGVNGMHFDCRVVSRRLHPGLRRDGLEFACCGVVVHREIDCPNRDGTPCGEKG